MKTVIRTGCILAILAGLIWIGQGTGLFPYPASSMMIGQHNWSLYGAALMLLGLFIGILALRR